MKTKKILKKAVAYKELKKNKQRRLEKIQQKLENRQ